MSITDLKTNNRIIHDKLEIANYMGDYFLKIGSVIQNKVHAAYRTGLNLYHVM